MPGCWIASHIGLLKSSVDKQQRVAIARAMINEPDIIIADEPTGSLDSEKGQGIMCVFTELHRSGKTIVMLTHEQELADFLPAVLSGCATDE